MCAKSVLNWVFANYFPGIKTPSLYFVDTDKIIMERVENSVTVRDHICHIFSQPDTDHTHMLTPLAKTIGTVIGKDKISVPNTYLYTFLDFDCLVD